MRQKLDQLFNIAPEQKNISEPIDIANLVDFYPHEVSPHIISAEYPSYRSVKQDGNSFYRICALHYLAHTDLYSYETTFPYADIQDCHGSTLPKIDTNYLLNFIWHRHLRVMAGNCSIERQKKLILLFNSSQFFDEAMVAYMRARNGEMIRSLDEELEDYVNVGLEMRRVYTIGQHSQELQKYTAARMLSANIKIFEFSDSGLRENQIQFGQYSIPIIKDSNNFNLLVSFDDCQRLKKATLTNNQQLKMHPINKDEKIEIEKQKKWEVKKIGLNDIKKSKVQPVKISKDMKLDFRSFQQFNQAKQDEIITLKNEKTPSISTLQDFKPAFTSSHEEQIVFSPHKRIKLNPLHRKYPAASSSRRIRDTVIFLILLFVSTTTVILV